MGIRTSYQSIPSSIVDFVETHPDVLELLGSWAGRRPLLRDLPELLRRAEKDRSILGDYGRLTLPTLHAFAASPHVSVLPTLIPSLTIDKAGPGIHFLLTGTKAGGRPPLRDLIEGGRELRATETSDTVPPRLLDPRQVLAIAEALQELDEDMLEERFDPDQMSALDIYPNMWTRDDDALEYLLEHYDALAAYVMDAAGRGHALVIATSL